MQAPCLSPRLLSRQHMPLGANSLPYRPLATAVPARHLTASCCRHKCRVLQARQSLSISSLKVSAHALQGRCAHVCIGHQRLSGLGPRRVYCHASSKADSSSTSGTSSNPSSSKDADSISGSSTAATGTELNGSSKQQHSKAGAAEAAHDAGSDDEFEFTLRRSGSSNDHDGNEHEDEYEDEYESGDEGSEDDGPSTADMTGADAMMEYVLRENTLNAAVLELAASMFAVGLQGSAALGLGYLIMHKSLFDSFRWNLADVETGLLYCLPVVALSAAITATPLPTHKHLMNKVMAAATAAAGGSSGSIGSDKTLSMDAFSDARRMATNASLVPDIPVRVVIGGDDGKRDERLLTSLSWDTATQALRYMQEFVSEPWSTKTYSLKTWAVRATGGLLRRLSVELFWRGLVVAGLAGWLYSSWETAGTSQDSPLFYARLFGLLTPQTALGVIAVILAATRIPADLARTQPAVTYTRLASMEVEVVGRLTEEDWLVMVLPAEVAAAAAATTAPQGKKSRKVIAGGNFDADLQEALTDKMQPFGRIKAAQAEHSSSSSSRAADGQQQQQQQPKLSKQEMEQQLDKLLAAVQDWKRKYSSSSSSSSTTAAASIPSVGFQLTDREQEAAELAAEFLELVKASAAAKAAAAVATKSKYIAKSAGLPSAKLGTGLETLLKAINDDPQRRLFLLHVGTDGSGVSIRRESGSSGSWSEDDDSSDDESSDDEDESSPGSVQAVLRAKARTAAEGARKDDASSSRKGGDSSSEKVRVTRRGSTDEAVDSLMTALKVMKEKQHSKSKEQDKSQGAAGASSSSSSSKKAAGVKVKDAGGDSGRDSDSDSDGEEEGLTFSKFEGLLKKQMKQLQTRDGQSSDLALYLKACKGAYRVAASIPTAQDRLAYSLLLCFALLEQLAVAGAFVASSGNLAASFTAAAALQIVTTTLQQAVGQRERDRLRKDIGGGWALQLQMFGPGP